MKKLLFVFMLMLVFTIASAVTWNVSLVDSYGDGWNGGELTVYVNGSAVLPGITLPGGFGPVYHSFEVENGDQITTLYTPGGWPDENEYYIYDHDGTLIASQGTGGAIPMSITSPIVVVAPVGLPGQVTNPSPANGVANVPPSGDLTWTFGSDTVTYDLWFGPLGAMTEVVTAATAGATGSYAYSGLSEYSTYEWQVIAHNENKATTNGPVWSFMTGGAPITTFPWNEDFEGTFLPPGWTKIVTAGNDITQTITQNHTAGGNYSCRFSSYSTSTNYNQYLFSPGFTVDPAYTRLSFWHRKYNTTAELLEWGIWTDTDPLNYTWTPVTLSNTEWLETVVDLSAYIGQTIYIGFHYYGDYLYWVYLDDVSITEPPSTPTYDVYPLFANFGTINLGLTASQVFTISNLGGGSLGITSVVLTGLDPDQYSLIHEDSYPVYLTPADPSTTVTVVFDPDAEGTFYAGLEITDDQLKIIHPPLPLEGTCVDYNSGGGDGGSIYGGYYYANNLAVGAPSMPTYSWITQTTNVLSDTPDSGTTDDGYWGPIPIGFFFHYYGNDYYELFIGTNGLITFGEGSTALSNTTLPFTSIPNDLLALFWDDLRYWPGESAIYYGGNASQFVITYDNVCHYSSSYDPLNTITAQVILYANGNIKMQYYDIIGTAHSATIGIENSDGTKGIQYHYNGTGGPYSTGTKGGGIAIGYSENPNTLPVELSSFTATLTAEMFVQLDWVAQSETNHLGYNVLRGESDLPAEAIQLNDMVISEGEQVGTQISYSFTDSEVTANTTYYYWLESVDLGGTSQMHGPITILVTGEPDDPGIPPLPPTVTKLLPAYPNPFNPSTNIRYALKEGSSVKIEIYNVKGQLMRIYENNYRDPGYYQISWDGKDMSGRNAASGVYLYRMTAGKYTSSRKMVLAK